MLTEQKVVDLLWSHLISWEYHENYLREMEQRKPPNCGWRHWLPLHRRGDGYCLKDWEMATTPDREAMTYDRHTCSTLGQVLGWKDIWTGWTIGDYKKRLPPRSFPPCVASTTLIAGRTTIVGTTLLADDYRT